jgi:hypothetical protein
VRRRRLPAENATPPWACEACRSCSTAMPRAGRRHTFPAGGSGHRAAAARQAAPRVRAGAFASAVFRTRIVSL